MSAPFPLLEVETVGFAGGQDNARSGPRELMVRHGAVVGGTGQLAQLVVDFWQRSGDHW